MVVMANMHEHLKASVKSMGRTVENLFGVYCDLKDKFRESDDKLNPIHALAEGQVLEAMSSIKMAQGYLQMIVKEEVKKDDAEQKRT